MWEESVGDWGPGLLEALREIEDPRKPKGVRHPLSAVLALSVCAMLSGARSLYAIAQWGREHPQFAQSLGFSRERTPCVATLHHVFRRLADKRSALAARLALGLVRELITFPPVTRLLGLSPSQEAKCLALCHLVMSAGVPVSLITLGRAV